MKNIGINDAVMHVPEGVCKVTEIIERDLSRYGIRQYYVLVPVYDRGTKIYIPTDAGSDKMKSLPEKDEVLQTIDNIPDCESVWIDNDKERMESFNKIISRCDYREMMALLHTLRNKHAEKVRTGKKFHSADERIFREAERILFGEFGYILDIEPSSVAGFISDRLGATAN